MTCLNRSIYETNSYDERGRLLSVQRGRDGEPYPIESFTYDDAGRPLGSREVDVGDGELYGATMFYYDENGVLKERDHATPPTHFEQETFDSAGRILSEGFDVYHGDSSTTQYTYDEQGRLTARETRQLQYTDSQHYPTSLFTTHFTFDDQGRVVLQDEVSIQSTWEKTVSEHHAFVFIYAPHLVRVEQHDDQGLTEGARELRYDAFGRLSQELFSGAMAQQQGSIHYAYQPCAGE